MNLLGRKLNLESMNALFPQRRDKKHLGNNKIGFQSITRVQLQKNGIFRHYAGNNKRNKLK